MAKKNGKSAPKLADLILEIEQSTELLEFPIREWKEKHPDLRTFVRCIGANEHQEFQLLNQQQREGEALAKLVCAVLCGESGEPIFKPAEWQRVAKFRIGILNRVALAAIKHSGLSDDEIETAVKNYEETRGSSS